MPRNKQLQWRNLTVGQRVRSSRGNYRDNPGTVVEVITRTNDGISQTVLVRWDATPTFTRLWSTHSLEAIDEETEKDVTDD